MAGLKQPADKSHFLLPDLGEGLVEAELIRWLVKPGEAVKESQPMAEMQTDKALVEVPSPWAGTISELCGKEGDIIKVAAVLVRYGVGVASATKPATAPTKTAAKESAPACVSSTRLISIESSFAIRRTAGVASDLPCGVFVDVVVARCSSSLRANRLATFKVPCILPTTVP